MAQHIRFHKTGGPEVLQIDEVPMPQPKAGEVLLKVKALGLNRAESMYRSGRYVIEPKFPAKLGYEASGLIEKVGDGVTNFAVGDAVSVIPAFMFDEYGLYGDYVIAPARALVKNPEGVSWETSAATWMAYTTAWGALIDIAQLGEGDYVVLGASSSSVGLAAMEMAYSVGATPINLTRSNDKVEQLKEAGAKHIINVTESDVEQEILKITSGKGARVVFDPVTGDDFERLIRATCKDAIVFIYGALSLNSTSIPVMHILGKHTTIRGYEFIEITADDEKLSRAKTFITERLASGEFKAQIAKTFEFSDIVAATNYLESNAQFGKVVVKL